MPEVKIPRDRSVPASIQFKNPGAMWPGAIATKWGSTKWQYLSDGTGQGGGGKGNKIAIFDSWVQGICAQLDMWRTSPHYKNQRFSVAINIWCGGNHTAEYIAHVKARIPGMNENTVMNDAFWMSSNGLRFLQVQAAHEAGRVIPAPATDWATAQQRVMAEKAPMSPATKKTVATGVVVNSATSTTAAVASSSGMPWWVIVLLIGGGIGLTVLAAWFFQEKDEVHPEIHTPATLAGGS